MDARRVSILGAGVLLAACGASAEIAYVDLPDTVVTLTTQCGNLLQLDLDRDGQSDYTLVGCEVEGSPGYRYIAVFDAENMVGSEGKCIRGFRKGETISIDASRSGQWSQVGWLLSTRDDCEWAAGGTLYLGFYLRYGSTINGVLGWIRLRALAPPVEGGLSIVVVDYAYENERFQDLRAGETGIIPVQPTAWGAVKRLYSNH